MISPSLPLSFFLSLSIEMESSPKSNLRIAQLVLTLISSVLARNLSSCKSWQNCGIETFSAMEIQNSRLCETNLIPPCISSNVQLYQFRQLYTAWVPYRLRHGDRKERGCPQGKTRERRRWPRQCQGQGRKLLSVYFEGLQTRLVIGR
jgi:hypothetical protein